MTRLRIGLLGPGMVGTKAVAPAIAASRGAVLTVVGSRSLARAQALAAPFRACGVEGYERVVDDPAVDVVYIALPNALHGEWILKAARAGKHVICEKPAVLTIQEAERVLDACRRARVRFLEAYMFRFHPQHALARDVLRRGTLGTVCHVDAAFGFPPLASDGFRYQRALGGGALYDAGGYTVAAARWLLEEEPEAGAAVPQSSADQDVDVRGAVQLRFPSGATAHVVFGFDLSYRNTYAVWGSRGRLVAERAFSVPRDFVPPITVATESGQTMLPTVADDQFRLMIDAFCDAVQSSAAGDRGFEAEFLAQAVVMEAVRQAAQQQQWVRVVQREPMVA